MIVLNYITDINETLSNSVKIDLKSQSVHNTGIITLYLCPYTTVCRQVVSDGEILVHDTMNDNTLNVTVTVSQFYFFIINPKISRID